MKPPYFTFAAVIALCGLSASLAQTPISRVPQAPPAVQAQALPMPADSALQQQVWALQQQVAVLQSQLNAVLAVVQVTPSGVTLTGTSVMITGGTVLVKSQNDLTLEGIANMKMPTSRALEINAGGNTSFRTGANLTLGSGGTTAFQASGTMNIKGSTIQLNGGANQNPPFATVGSQVQVMVGGLVGTGQIVSGSSTVFGNQDERST